MFVDFEPIKSPQSVSLPLVSHTSGYINMLLRSDPYLSILLLPILWPIAANFIDSVKFGE